MPTYEYFCSSCNDVFEAFQSMRDAPLSVCPQCGKTGVKRLIGRGAGIIFKGSGFYETDYKRAGQKKDSGGDGGESAKPASAKAPTSSKESPGSAGASPASPSKKD